MTVVIEKPNGKVARIPEAQWGHCRRRPRYAGWREMRHAPRQAPLGPTVLVEKPTGRIVRMTRARWEHCRRRPRYAEWRSLQHRPHPPSEIPWQTWCEEGGRWVPDGWLRPGYFADPPAFDPLPGEVQYTPARPAGCFQSEIRNLKSAIDVVIPLSAGSRHEDAELRYCLRSIERHLENVGRVWIVGHRPKWLRCEEARESRESDDWDSRDSRHSRVIHLPCGDSHRSKDVNIIRKLEAACKAGVSERFVFWSDDQILLRPLAFSQLGPYTWGDVPPGPGSNRWRRRLAATGKWLRAQGRPALHCDTHVPVPMERSRLLDLAERTRDAWQSGDGLTVGTWYCNAPSPSHPVTPSPMGDRKATIEAVMPAEELRRRIAGRWFLGFNDAGFTPELRKLLDELFPEKSRFEEPPTIRVKPAGPTLSIIIPTIGRPTLKRTLESIRKQQLVEGDEVIVVQDGPAVQEVRRVIEASGLPGRYLFLDRHYADFGATPRNHGMTRARGEYLAFHDDDDIYRPGAFAAIRAAATRQPGRPLMFRNWVKVLGRTRWEDKTVRPVNVGTPMFITPKDFGRLTVWPSHRGSDFGFICNTLRKWPAGSVAWRPEVVSDYLDPGGGQARPMKRNLLYHIYPVAANDEWRHNVERLLRYWGVFNSRKIVGIVHDERTVPVETVQAAFPDDGIEWLIQPNDPHLGEVVTFAEGIERLRSLDPDEATFYAHAKGVLNGCAHANQRSPEVRALIEPSVRRWRNLMYERGLNVPTAKLDAILRAYVSAGSLQVWQGIGRHEAPDDPPAYWHYAGTFYWLNHMRYFGHHHPTPLRINRWAVEYHLGAMFPKEEGFCFCPRPPEEPRSHYTMTEEQWDELEASCPPITAG